MTAPVGRDGVVIGYVHNVFGCGGEAPPGATVIYDADGNRIGEFVDGLPRLDTDATG